MEILSGRPVSPGYAKGIAVVYGDGYSAEIPRYTISEDQVDRELARFHRALERSRDELQQLERRVWADLGETYSTIFSAHLDLLQDRQFAEQVRQRVQRDRVNVEQALDAEVSKLVGLLGSLDNEYLSERARDIRDLGNRLMRQLIQGEVRPFSRLAPCSIIVAHELLPSETVDLDREHVVGIVTVEGGETGHAAILARALGIPAVTAVAEAPRRIPTGAEVLVDGCAGLVTIAPNSEAIAQIKVQQVRYDEARAAVLEAETLDCVTLDGVGVSMWANLNRLEEVEQVALHHFDGVGLFRTEFLYLDAATPPSWERQLDLYRCLLHGLEGRPLVVRTLDVSGDKVPRFLNPRHSPAHHRGLRGLRFSLARPNLFTPQLRALLAASSEGDLRILFPMVLGKSDLAEAVEHVHRLAEELGLTRTPQLGAMIETPAAVFSLPEILQLVDFVSIGTNDLTQFMLAADRDAAEGLDEHSILHPSVLRAIRHVVEGCREAERDLCVCGEAAGDAATACLLVGLGVRCLSMSPTRAAGVRAAIRQMRHEALAELAKEAARADSAERVEDLLRRADYRGNKDRFQPTR